MNISNLSDYRFLYGSSNRKGVSHIFNEYMSFDKDNIVPVSISHGVDFEHCYEPMDIYSREPIHWASNTRIYERAKKIKPCLLMAHPWSIIVNEKDLIKGSGTLIIGPPPGMSNDQLLYDKIKKDIASDWAILIKGGVKGSIQFWKEKGVKPITVGNDENNRFFHDLFYLLSSYRNIVACTFSSAAIFAASIGKKIIFIDGYEYTNYDTPEYLNIVNFESKYSKYVVSEFLNGTKDNVSDLARDILGFDLISQKEKAKYDYLNILSSLDSPIFCDTQNKILLYSKIYLARKLSRPSFVNKSFVDLSLSFKNRIIEDKKSVIVKTLDEISIWTEGRNESNFNVSYVPHEKGVTIPGKAVDGY